MWQPSKVTCVTPQLRAPPTPRRGRGQRAWPAGRFCFARTSWLDPSSELPLFALKEPNFRYAKDTQPTTQRCGCAVAAIRRSDLNDCKAAWRIGLDRFQRSRYEAGALFSGAVSVSREPTHQPTPSGSMHFFRVQRDRRVLFPKRSDDCGSQAAGALCACCHAIGASILMTAVVSIISTLKSLGPTPLFLATWPAAWGLSWLVAFPTLLVVLPLVRRIVAIVVAPSVESLR